MPALVKKGENKKYYYALSVHRDTVACSYLSTAYHIKQRAISHSQLPCYSAFTDLTLVCKGPD